MTTIYSRRHPKSKNEFFVLKTDTPNGNGRIYARDMVVEQIKKYMQLPSRFGTFMDDHAISMDLSKISHTVDKVWLHGDEVYAKISRLGTPKGDILAKLLDNDLVEFRMAGICQGYGPGGEVLGWTMLSVNAVAKGSGS